ETIKRSRKFGFAGGTCVHPSQVAILNEGYGYSADDVDRARRMIATYDDAMAKGLGAVTFEGKMIDVPVVERAQNVLRQAAKHAARPAKYHRHSGAPRSGEPGIHTPQQSRDGGPDLSTAATSPNEHRA